MKFAEPLESQRLSFLLENAASREDHKWKAYTPKKPPPGCQDTDISPVQRDEAVCWLIDLHDTTRLYPETLSLAISILDRFLATVKRVPLLRDLASSSGCGCSPSEILRMERIVLDKLNWDLHSPTPLEFLHIFHALVLSCKSQLLVGLLGCNLSQHLCMLTRQLHSCLADSTLLQGLSRGSMLALALITLDLENICPDWLALTIHLLRKAQIDSSELIRCRELVSRRLSTKEASLPPNNTVYIYRPSRPSPSLAPGPCDQEGEPNIRLRSLVEEMEVDEFYDGIKRLYNEENWGAPEGAAVTAEGQGFGGGDVLPTRQEVNNSPCPPLQPVSLT
uniref:Cyclin N-terminal domain-containing protein n=1 Tax=Esox lucius TaxID=8010 RepID=A0A6Q2WUV1_ESOLU